MRLLGFTKDVSFKVGGASRRGGAEEVSIRASQLLEVPEGVFLELTALLGRDACDLTPVAVLSPWGGHRPPLRLSSMVRIFCRACDGSGKLAARASVLAKRQLSIPPCPRCQGRGAFWSA